jgi:hypothetical protein
MKFLRAFKHKEFENICGFDGVKDIISRVLDSGKFQSSTNRSTIERKDPLLTWDNRS